MKKKALMIIVALISFCGLEKVATACSNIDSICLFDTDCCSGLCSWFTCFHTCMYLECKDGDSWCINSDGNFDHVDEGCISGSVGYCSTTYCKNGNIVYDDVTVTSGCKSNGGYCYAEESTVTKIMTYCDYGCEESAGSVKCKPAPCTNDCDNNGENDCKSATVLQTCGNYDADSCLEWGSFMSCPCYLGKCQTCSDECNMNSSGCNGGGQKWNCTYNSNTDCYEKKYTSCPFGEICFGGNCIDSCDDNCSPSGSKECLDSNSIHTCGNYNGNSCLEWGDEQSCQCYNDACQSCSDECSSSEDGCNSSGTKKWSCKFNNSNGCYYKEYVSCGIDEECKNGECGKFCTSECNNLWETECLSNTSIHTCGSYDIDACLEWGAEQSCQCYNDACQSCTDACNKNDVGCDIFNTQKWNCLLDLNTGCYKKNYTNCDLLSTCSNGSCVSACTNDCSPSGEQKCMSETSVKSCGNFDDDLCFEWGNFQSCNCYNNACQSCTDECKSSDTGCDMMGLQKWICLKDLNTGCYKKNFSKCLIGVCLLGVCVAGCDNECTVSGNSECLDETTMHTCGEFDGDDCLDWGGEQACPCFNNACQECANECDVLDIGCNSTGTKKWNCQYNLTAGCYKKEYVNCTSGTVCQNGACESNCGSKQDHKACAGNKLVWQNACNETTSIIDNCDLKPDVCNSSKDAVLSENVCFEQALVCSYKTSTLCTCGCENNVCKTPCCKNNCTENSEGCEGTNKWICKKENGCLNKKYTACLSSEKCAAGECVPSCIEACAENGKECVDSASYHLCDCSQPGCCVWGKIIVCQSMETCDQGKCVTQVEPAKAIKFAKLVEWPYEPGGESYSTALNNEQYLDDEEADEIPLQYIENYQIFAETSGPAPTLKVNGQGVTMVYEGNSLYSYRLVFDETKENATNNYTVKVNDNGTTEKAEMKVFVQAIDYATASGILGSFFGLASDSGLKELAELEKYIDSKIPLNPVLEEYYLVYSGKNYDIGVWFTKNSQNAYEAHTWVYDTVNKKKLHIIDDTARHIDDYKIKPKAMYEYYRSTFDPESFGRGAPVETTNVVTGEKVYVTLSEQNKVVRFMSDPPWKTTPIGYDNEYQGGLAKAAEGARNYLKKMKVWEFKARPETMEVAIGEIKGGSGKLGVNFAPALKVVGKVLVALAIADIAYSLYQGDYKATLQKAGGLAVGLAGCEAGLVGGAMVCSWTFYGVPICALVGCLATGITTGYLASEVIGILYEITIETDQGDEQFEIMDAPQYLASEGKYGGFAYNLMDEMKSTCNNVGFSTTTMCLDYKVWQDNSGFILYEPDNDLIYPSFTAISSNPETATTMQIYMENNDESQGYVKYNDKNFFVWQENGGYALQPIDAAEMPFGFYTEFTLTPNFGIDETCVSQSNTKPIAKAKVIDVDLDEQAEVPIGVGLSGVDSYDANNDQLTYLWEQLAGFPLEYDKSATHIKLNVPKAGVYKFKLTVNDGQVESAPDEVEFLVEGVADDPTTPKFDTGKFYVNTAGCEAEAVWLVKNLQPEQVTDCDVNFGDSDALVDCQIGEMPTGSIKLTAKHDYVWPGKYQALIIVVMNDGKIYKAGRQFEIIDCSSVVSAADISLPSDTSMATAEVQTAVDVDAKEDESVEVWNYEDHIFRHPICSASSSGDWRSLLIVLLGVGFGLSLMRVSSKSR